MVRILSLLHSSLPMASVSLRVKAVSQGGLGVSKEFIPCPLPGTVSRHATLCSCPLCHIHRLLAAFRPLQAHFTLSLFTPAFSIFLDVSSLGTSMTHCLTQSAPGPGEASPDHPIQQSASSPVIFLSLPLHHLFRLRDSTAHCWAHRTTHFTFLFLFSRYLNGKLQINWGL